MTAIELEGGIVRVELREPPLNILTRSVLADLRNTLHELRVRTDLRVLLITAEGRHFSAGASVEEHLPPDHGELIDEFAATVVAMYEFPVPVIAVVQGRCLGGAFELVQAADFIIAADDAQFGQPEILLGVFPPVACALLPWRVGQARAAELLFTGDAIDAVAAHTAGLVTRVVAREDLNDAAHAFARRIARHSAGVLRVLKRTLHVAAQGDAAGRIAQASRAYTDELMVTHDAVEGLMAFVEKRTPQWSHQ